MWARERLDLRRAHPIDGLNALETLDLIDEAIAILSRHPLIGRQAESGLRELAISHGRTGYVARYSYEAEHDAILVLAIRHQREAGFGQAI